MCILFLISVRRKENFMGCLGNIIWMLCGGLVSALGYLIAGCIWCITIVGIPVGMQCFKLAGLALFPFGRMLHTVVDLEAFY